ncbi:hypothetical protein K466DRAFT_312161 [Polyporus arcularius HHB13444]|uniref:Uncharacterized protein n=1 Tax=Polyporus arcularius HHB13444 TaxID=1314778 RepID=A0A5C3NYG5_9APHY|nr:hypothetical protein K466DRAFT_312161 [Polyporus arcularius HHB13444]
MLCTPQERWNVGPREALADDLLPRAFLTPLPQCNALAGRGTQVPHLRSLSSGESRRPHSASCRERQRDRVTTRVAQPHAVTALPVRSQQGTAREHRSFDGKSTNGDNSLTSRAQCEPGSVQALRDHKESAEVVANVTAGRCFWCTLYSRARTEEVSRAAIRSLSGCNCVDSKLCVA